MTDIATAQPASLATNRDAAVQGRAAGVLLASMEALPLSRWHFKARLIIGTATFFDAIDTVAIGLVLPVIGQAWHLTPGEIGWLISGGFFGQMIGAIGFGQLAERIGRIRTMMFTISIFALGGIATTFAAGLASMLAFRIFQGLGMGAQVPVAATYINEIAPASKRGTFVLLYEFIFAFGIVVAGFVGRWATPELGVAVAVSVWQRSPADRAVAAGAWHVAGIAALAGTERQAGASRRGHHAHRAGDPPLWPGNPRCEDFGGTGRHRNGSMEQTVRCPVSCPYLLIWIIWITVGFISWPLTIWLPTIYRNVFKVSLEQALNFGMINNVIILAATLSCAMLIDRTGRKAWFTAAFVLAGASLCMLGILGASDVTIGLVLTGLTLFGISSLNLAIYLYTPELYPTRLRAQGVGIALAWSRAAGMIAPPVIGWGLATNGLSTVFAGLGAISLVTALATAWLAIETRHRVLEEISP
jgi:MFS transporter, putative metabolite:H+ symporter